MSGNFGHFLIPPSPHSYTFYFYGTSTGNLHYSRTFYLRFCLFTLEKMVQNDNFPVKNGLFICKFKIRGPKWRNVSTTNNKGNLYYRTIYYYLFTFTQYGEYKCITEHSSSYPVLKKILQRQSVPGIVAFIAIVSCSKM